MAKLMMIAGLLIMGTMMMAATVTDAQATCAQSLVPCAPYLNNATIQPQDDCCDPIRQAVQTQLTCLCNLFNDPTLLNSFNVSVTEALRISRACGVTTDFTACNATATPPTSTPPPPGEAGGADRIALTGITALFLFLVSTALY